MRNTVRTIFTMDSEVKNLLEEAYGDDYRDDFEDSLEEFGNEGDELEYEDDDWQDEGRNDLEVRKDHNF